MKPNYEPSAPPLNPADAVAYHHTAQSKKIPSMLPDPLPNTRSALKSLLLAVEAERVRLAAIVQEESPSRSRPPYLGGAASPSATLDGQPLYPSSETPISAAVSSSSVAAVNSQWIPLHQRKIMTASGMTFPRESEVIREESRFEPQHTPRTNSERSQRRIPELGLNDPIWILEACPPDFHFIPLEDGLEGASPAVGWFKDKLGFIHLTGTIRVTRDADAKPGSFRHFFTLPEAACPHQGRFFAVQGGKTSVGTTTYTHSVVVRLEILETGEVTTYDYCNWTEMCLDGVVYVSSANFRDFDQISDPVWLNGAKNDDFFVHIMNDEARTIVRHNTQVNYFKDPLGYVHFCGVVDDVPLDRPVCRLPKKFRPARGEKFCCKCDVSQSGAVKYDNPTADVSILKDGVVIVFSGNRTGDRISSVCLDGIVFEARRILPSRRIRVCRLRLNSEFGFDESSWEGARVLARKDDLGIVRLSGTVARGQKGKVICTLPEGFRPKRAPLKFACQTAFTLRQRDTMSVLVNSNGEVVLLGGFRKAFLDFSLSGIVFDA